MLTVFFSFFFFFFQSQQKEIKILKEREKKLMNELKKDKYPVIEISPEANV